MNDFAVHSPVSWSDDAWPPGTQTLGRGLSIVHAVSSGARTLSELAPAIGCTRSTTQRLTSALLRRGWLQVTPGGHFALGPQLGRLARQAQPGTPLAAISRPTLESLAERTRDALVLGVRSEDRVLCLEGVESRRGVPMCPAVGESYALGSTGLGLALLLDEEEPMLQRHHREAGGERSGFNTWMNTIRTARTQGFVVDLTSDGRSARGISVPLRDTNDTISGAIGLSSAPAFLGRSRVEILAPLLVQAAIDISRSLVASPAGSG